MTDLWNAVVIDVPLLVTGQAALTHGHGSGLQ